MADPLSDKQRIACVYRTGCETPNDCREHGYCRSPKNAAPQGTSEPKAAQDSSTRTSAPGQSLPAAAAPICRGDMNGVSLPREPTTALVNALGETMFKPYNGLNSAMWDAAVAAYKAVIQAAEHVAPSPTLSATASAMQGHGEPCYWCEEPCDGLAANPGRWPIPLCHSDEPGVVKWHHDLCVYERLIENQPQRIAPEAERKVCEWTPDDDLVHHTGCGHAFVFDSGTPEENSAKFCQYCGGNLVVSPQREPKA